MANVIRAVDPLSEKSLLKAGGSDDFYVYDHGTRRAYAVFRKEYQQWLASGPKRIIFDDIIKTGWKHEPEIRVMTAFDGRNQQGIPDMPPEIFETRVYGGFLKNASRWSDTYDNAKFTHEMALGIVRKFDCR